MERVEEFGFSKPLWIFEERVSKRERERETERAFEERERWRERKSLGVFEERELGWVFEES